MEGFENGVQVAEITCKGFSLGETSEKITNGDKYVTVSIVEVLKKYSEDGSEVNTSLLNVSKTNFFETIAMVHPLLNKVVTFGDDIAILNVCNLILRGCKATVSRRIGAQGAERTFGQGTYERNIIINSIDKIDGINDNTVAFFLDDIKEEVKDGKARKAEAIVKAKAAKDAAKAAILAKLQESLAS